MDERNGSDIVLTPIPWEERNLGRASFQLVVDTLTSQSEQALHARLQELKAKGPVFVQARVEDQDTEKGRILTRAGFYVVECTVDPHTVLARNEALRRFKECPESFLPEKWRGGELTTAILDRASREESEDVLRIAEESFVADRFHIDKACPPGRAGLRYRYWTEDLLRDEEVSFMVMKVRGHTAGFFAFKQDYLILAGFARAYANSGLGDFFWLSVMKHLEQHGVTSVHTRVSLNNLPVVNLYARLGFKFRNSALVFHYWSECD